MARFNTAPSVLMPALLLSMAGLSACGEGEDTGMPTNATISYTWFQDSDGDGYGNPDSSTEAGTQPTGYVDNNGDCDDTDAAVNPGAMEECDDIDNNCDGNIDEGLTSTWYPDEDGDGYGDTTDATVGCDLGSGYVEEGGDCDDGDADSYPGATEYCDGLDNDCNDIVDDDAVDAYKLYVDADLDGFGTPDEMGLGCPSTEGLSENALDCDDTDATINPDADEYCDGVDNNCNDEIDEPSALDATSWCIDDDGDGFGDPETAVNSCSELPGDRIDDCNDCLDIDPAVNPDADEICGNGVDDDCDGDTDEKDCSE